MQKSKITFYLQIIWRFIKREWLKISFFMLIVLSIYFYYLVHKYRTLYKSTEQILHNYYVECNDSILKTENIYKGKILLLQDTLKKYKQNIINLNKKLLEYHNFFKKFSKYNNEFYNYLLRTKKENIKSLIELNNIIRSYEFWYMQQNPENTKKK